MKFYIVDVFAEQKYQGNQLAVLIPDRDIDAKEMQQIARETNFSETTFITSDRQKNGGYNVRIFTPGDEVPFAGHPTLGTAYIIYKNIEQEKNNKIILNLGVGEIPVTIKDGILTMEQKQPEFGLIAEDLKEIASILKINEGDIIENYPVQVVSTGLPALIIPLKTYDALKRCAVNHDLYHQFLDKKCKCNLLAFFAEKPDNKTAPTSGNVRVRVFVDDPGFVEDPATGSANGNLAGYFLKYNYLGSSKISYNAHQGVEMNRPSLLQINAELQNGIYTIKVGGKVFPIADGNWGR